MKKLLFFLSLAPLFSLTSNAQCIFDVHYLLNSPEPCHFVGTVNFDNSDCVDFFHPEWKYVWKISGGGDGDLIAVYDGMVFEHKFEKFGGYDFCLEIHKDGTTLTPPSHIECVSYTTCEPCGGDIIEYDYIQCPIGEGCNMAFTTKIKAENMIGLKPKAKYILTYRPTGPEIQGGYQTTDIVFDNVDVEFHPDSGYIYVAEDLNVTFKRGCFTPRLELEMEYGAGAHHNPGGAPCTEVVLRNEESFRCIACNEPGFGCNASLKATEITNETGECDIFVCISNLENRDAEFDTDPIISKSLNVLQIYPNPASTRVHVEMPETTHDDMTIHLFDSFGKLEAEKKLQGVNSTDLDVTDLRSGLYMLVVQAQGKVIFTEKLVVNH